MLSVEQAVFGSSVGQAGRGYHLFAKSSGIDEAMVNELQQWGPSHGALLSGSVDSESLNFHPIGRNQIAISRTIFGGPEYSRRGGLQVVTRFLLMDVANLNGFSTNPWFLLQTCLVLGRLRLYTGTDPKMPKVRIPEGSFLRHEPKNRTNLSHIPIQELVQILQMGNPAALVGCEDVSSVLDQIMKLTSSETRSQLSFTTGLRPSVHRPFRLHFIPKSNIDLNRQLTQLGISCVTCNESFSMV